MLTLNDIKVTYPDKTKALKGISFSVDEGECVALIGANGAGKTTLLLSMLGVIESSGMVLIDGTELNRKSLSKVREKMGVVFQNPDDQLFMPTVYDDIAFGLLNYGMSREDAKKVILDTAKLLSIENVLYKSSSRLSGGQKRMAAIATVLAMNPSVMLFDEPTAFLDPKSRRNLVNTLLSIKKTKIIATHDLFLARELCDRVIILREGSVFADVNGTDILFNETLMEESGVEAIKNIF